MSTGYWVKGGQYFAALTDGSTLVLCKSVIGRMGRSVAEHFDDKESAILAYQAQEKRLKDDGYEEDLMPHHISKGLIRHLTKEPLAKLDVPLKFKPKVEAFV